MTRVLAAAVLALLALAPAVGAHEVRPASLEIKETAPGRYDVVWRTPVMSGMRLPVALRFSDGVRDVGEPTVQELTDSVLERRSIDAGEGGLAGTRVEFPGLEGTITDVLVRVEMADGTTSTKLVIPSQPWVEIAASQGPLEVAGVPALGRVERARSADRSGGQRDARRAVGSGTGGCQQATMAGARLSARARGRPVLCPSHPR